MGPMSELAGMVECSHGDMRTRACPHFFLWTKHTLTHYISNLNIYFWCHSPHMRHQLYICPPQGGGFLCHSSTSTFLVFQIKGFWGSPDLFRGSQDRGWHNSPDCRVLRGKNCFMTLCCNHLAGWKILCNYESLSSIISIAESKIQLSTKWHLLCHFEFVVFSFIKKTILLRKKHVQMLMLQSSLSKSLLIKER